MFVLKKGHYNNHFCGQPGNWFIHRMKDSDFILYDYDKEKIVDIRKPVITIEYHNEKYLYVFIINDEGCQLEKKLNQFLLNSENIYKINDDIVIVLSNNIIDNYDIESESNLDYNGDIIEDDEMGSSLFSSQLRYDGEELDKDTYVSSGIF